MLVGDIVMEDENGDSGSMRLLASMVGMGDGVRFTIGGLATGLWGRWLTGEVTVDRNVKMMQNLYWLSTPLGQQCKGGQCQLCWSRGSECRTHKPTYQWAPWFKILQPQI